MAESYLMTHSLLSAWLYALKGNPFEDATTEKDAFEDFMRVLRREPTETTEAMQKGIDFEDLVTAIINNDETGMKENPCWFDAAVEVAEIVRGGILQYKAKRTLVVDGMTFVLYGHLDALKAGVVYDIKFSGSYERGKYYDSTQHPVYLKLIPQAKQFVYLVSNGSAVWTETYWPEETSDITDIIRDFIAWLTINDLLDTYKDHWKSVA